MIRSFICPTYTNQILQDAPLLYCQRKKMFETEISYSGYKAFSELYTKTIWNN